MLTEIDINSPPPPPPQKVGWATNRVTSFRYLDHPPGRVAVSRYKTFVLD